MGKRNREVPVGRRRPMIQLGSSQKGGVVNRNNIKEEEKEKIDPSSSSSKGDHIDTELAGFLAEINALEVPSENSSLSVTGNSKTENRVDSQLYDPNAFDPATQGHLLPEPWQVCYDATSAYHYYWNTVTNEVQWYPPVAMAPPPPPPPTVEKPNISEQVDDEMNSEKSESNENKEQSGTCLKQRVLTNVEYSSGSDDESLKDKQTQDSEVSAKEKDRELMSKIKEKIKRKKQEKMQREKEEQERNKREVGVETFLEHKDTEEELREKLIKKKLEREKTKLDEQDDSNDYMNTTVDADESFTVDIFAIEEDSSAITEAKEEGDQNVNTNGAFPEKKNVSIEKSKDDTLLKDGKGSCKENTPSKDGKGSWRIVDAVYDDEDDIDNSDKDNDGHGDNHGNDDNGDGCVDDCDHGKEQDKENEQVHRLPCDTEKNSKSSVEMDSYVDMLLEDGIDDKEELKPRKIENKETKKIKREVIDPPTPCEPALPPDVPPPPPPDDQLRPPLPPEDELLPELPKVSAETEEANRKEICALSTQIFEKLDFLGISTKDLRNLLVYFIELETRMRDWQAGALDSQYLLDRLRELDLQIIEHEEKAAPSGWLCYWSSNFKMYYYHNTLTGESQWDYPDVHQIPTDSQTNADQITCQPRKSIGMNYMHPLNSESSVISLAHRYNQDGVSNEIKKRASDTVMNDPYRDPYRKKFKESGQDDDNTPYSGNESGTSSPLPLSIIAAPVIHRSSRESSPTIYAPPVSAEDFHENSAVPKIIKLASNGKLKVKKKKKLESSGIPSKKLKHVSSLVQKWQTVKQKVEEEENIEEESENEDYEVQAEKRINEWKKEAQISGETDFNPNFTEIKGDWRERLKRKTTT